MSMPLDYDYMAGTNAHDSEQLTWRDLPDPQLCDCGHEDEFWMLVDGKTLCNRCLNDLDDEAQWHEVDSAEVVSTRIRNQFDADGRAG